MPLDTAPHRTSGRPQDETLDVKILDAAADLLADVGYDALSVEAVARLARTAKTTVYRRWKTKPELVVAAIKQRYDARGATPVDTGSLRGDLLAEVERFAALMSDDALAHMAGLFIAVQREPELAAEFRARLIEPNQASLLATFRRAADRGEIAETVLDNPIVLDLIPSMVHSRRFALGQAVDHAFATQLIDTILLPVVHAAAPTDTSREAQT